MSWVWLGLVRLKNIFEVICSSCVADLAEKKYDHIVAKWINNNFSPPPLI